jgi:hypothetical protein
MSDAPTPGVSQVAVSATLQRRNCGKPRFSDESRSTSAFNEVEEVEKIFLLIQFD